MDKSLYTFPNQKPDAGIICGVGGKRAKGARAQYDSARYQRGYLVFTVASGVLTLAAANEVELFRYGVGETAAGAGFPAHSGADVLFSVDDTNVSRDNGLNGVAIVSAGVRLGEPHYITTSAAGGHTVLRIDSGVELAAYRDSIVRSVSEYVRMDFVRDADEEDEQQSVSFGLGAIIRNAAHRGSFADSDFPHTGATPGLPVGMGMRFEVPAADGAEDRPFAVKLVNTNPIRIAAQTSNASATVYVPVMVDLEVERLS